MKNTLKLMGLLLVSNFGYSQIYYSRYLDQTSEWKVIEHHGEAGYHDITFRTIFFGGIENLNGFTYYKMYQTFYKIGYDGGYSVISHPQSNTITRFIGYLREDPNGKFYLLNTGAMPFFLNYQVFNPGVENVFFDNQIVLNSQIGDLYFNNFNTSLCPVDSLGLMTINGTNYKLILSSFGGKSLEGVGDILNSCDSPYSLDSGLTMFIRIHCYTKQGQTYSFYNNYFLGGPYFIDCTTFPNADRQSLDVVTYENSSFKVFPNPANTVVTITSNNKNIKAVTLCDLQGRILKNIDVNTINTPFDISNYQSGTYLLIIKTDSETRKSKLVIE
jgi:hypothetical protein